VKSYISSRFAATATLLASLVGAATAAPKPTSSPDRATRGFVLRAGKVYPGDAAPIKDAAIVVREGRIVAVLPAGAPLPNDLPLVDRSHSVVTPGFVVAESRLSDAFEDRFPTSFGTIVTIRSVDPLRRAIDGFSFVDRRDAVLSGGVTTAYLAPGTRRLVNGRGAVVKLAGETADQRTIREVADLYLSIGDSAEGLAAKFEAPLPPSAEVTLRPAEQQFARTRAGAIYGLRLAFSEAHQFAKSWRAETDPARRPQFSPEQLALAELLQAKTPVRVRTNADVDVLAALDLLQEHGLRGALVGGYEADTHTSKIKSAEVSAIVELPIAGDTGLYDVNARWDLPKNAARTSAALAAGGVRVALAPSDDSALPTFPLLLAHAIRGGWSAADALRSVTFDAAKILGVEDRVGSIAPGRDADLVVLSGEPGDAWASVLETYSSGICVFNREEAERRRRDYLEETRPKQTADEAGGTVVVRAGLVVPVSGPPIANGSVAIQNGRIVSVGASVAVPRGARVIDAGPQAVVTPGLIDARSYLGLGAERSAYAGNAALEHLAVPSDPDFRLVASGGVTTVLLHSPGYLPTGSPVAALKTGGHWTQAVVREACGVAIPSLGPNPEAYKALLQRGKQYSERWDKYFVDSDKEKAEAKKTGDAKPADAADSKKEDKKDSEPEAAVTDPITGTWQGEISGGPLPQPQPFTLRLRLRGDVVSGTVEGRGPMGREPQEFDGGSFKDNTVTINVSRPELPFPLKIEAKLDKPDHMVGSVDARVLKLDFEATRTEKVAPTITAKPKGRKRGVEMPPVDDNLEPFRRVFHGDAAIVVAAETKDDIQAAVTAVVDEFKLPLVIAGGSQATELASMLAAKGVGVLSGPALPFSSSQVGVPVAVELASAGVPMALGTGSSTGARDIAGFAAFAISRGLGGDQILKALTLEAAKLFCVDQRVGSLAPGRDGDLVVWSGAPFSAAARVQLVVVGGIVAFDEAEAAR